MTNPHEGPDVRERFNIPEGKALLFDPDKFEFILQGKQTEQRLNVFEKGDAIKIFAQHIEDTGPVQEIEKSNGLFIPFGFFGDLVVEMPELRNAISLLSDQEVRKIKDIVEDIMFDVFLKMRPELKEHLDRDLLKGGAGMGFYAGFDREGGTFRLNTLGSCACFGVVPDERSLVGIHYGEDMLRDTTLPIPYGEHNIDNDVQRASIYAGIAAVGHYVMEIDRKKEHSSHK